MEFLEQIVTELTGQKPEISVEEDQHGAVITVATSGRMPSLIGKNGGTIDAIRTLVKALGYNDKHRIKLRIHESTNGQSSN